MAAILPKGLAAAVLASIPLQENLKGGDFIQSVVFSVILFSIIITSVLIFMFDKMPRFKQFYYTFLRKFSDINDDEKVDMENIDVNALPDYLNKNH